MSIFSGIHKKHSPNRFYSAFSLSAVLPGGCRRTGCLIGRWHRSGRALVVTVLTRCWMDCFIFCHGIISCLVEEEVAVMV